MDSGRFLSQHYGYFAVELYHLERNHQGLGNRLIIPMKATVNTEGRIERRTRLGGLLNYYYRGVDV